VDGRVEASAGGAGLYMSLGASAAGADVTMVAPRPDPVPGLLEEAVSGLRWIGPETGPRGLPRFEIRYEGERAVYAPADFGAEAVLGPEHLPPLSAGDVVCVAPLTPRQSLDLARAVRAAGALAVVTTYENGIRRDRASVRRAAATADVFLCNEREGGLLFGQRPRAAPGKILVVTRGRRGARLWLGDHEIALPAVRAATVDPTGAGDTFAGAFAARLALGDHPAEAGRVAAELAALATEGVGPDKLVSGRSTALIRRVPRSPGVRLCDSRITAVAKTLRSQAAAVTPFDFTGDVFPPPGHGRAMDFFFAATVQQFGFWELKDGAYGGPMYGTVGGRTLKGSDYLWAVCRRWLQEAPEELDPAGQAALTVDRFTARTRSDNGTSPLRAPESRLAVARDYGRDMEALSLSPAGVTEIAGSAPHPLKTFFTLMDRIGGYKEDPLRKKSALLAMILVQRPERWLVPGPGEELPPIVDYHVQRSALRLGLIEVTDPALLKTLAARRLVSANAEHQVRLASAEAVKAVCRESDLPMGAVDRFFFGNRNRCLETETPLCSTCPADPACAHRTELFQPVFRTTAY